LKRLKNPKKKQLNNQKSLKKKQLKKKLKLMK
jgi:hypothetical protein